MATYYISTTGNTSSNDGSIGAPFDINGAFACTGTAASANVPGNRFKIRGGVYLLATQIGPRSVGTSLNHIVYEPYAGEWVEIDGKNLGSGTAIFMCYAGVCDATNPAQAGVTGLPVSGFAQFTDIYISEIYNSSAPKPNPFNQVAYLCKGAQEVRFLDTYIHDTGFGIELLSADVGAAGHSDHGGSALNCSAIGNIIQYCGKAGGGTDGHGIYTQCNLTGANYQKWLGNISHHNAGWGFHGFPHVEDIQYSKVTVDSCCSYGAKTGFGGGPSPDNAADFLLGGDCDTTSGTYTNLYNYSPSGRNTSIAYVAVGINGNVNGITMQSCKFMGQARFRGMSLPGSNVIGGAGGLANRFSDAAGVYTNQYADPSDTTTFPATFPNNTIEAGNPPDYVYIWVHPVTPGRGHLYILNETAQANTVNANLSGILSVGDTYEIRHASDYKGAKQTGTYAGGNVAIVMTGLTIAAPLGGETAPASYGSPAKFAAFVVIKTGTAVVTVTPSNPGAGIVGQAYTPSSFSASGGTGPYTYAVTAGSLPAGISLNSSTGALSGTPTTPGLYNFTVTATDSLSATGNVAATMLIVTGSGSARTFFV